MKRGHSNVHVQGIVRYPASPSVALIPIEGGADVYTVKELPPLALHENEWHAIGKFMGWL